MPQDTEAFFSPNHPDVINERNKRIAALIGKELEYGASKMQELYNEICVFAADPTSHRVIEHLYEKLWLKKTKLRQRDDIKKIVTRCHEEAFEHLQTTNPDVWNLWVAKD